MVCVCLICVSLPLIRATGYRRLYWGYMMSELFSRNRAETVCVDASAVPMPVLSSKGDQNGGLLYPSMMHDTFLAAYPVYWELSCAVCEGALW